MSMRTGSTRFILNGAFYSMAHVAWGDPANEPVLCVHGLSRNGRDFDGIAAALSERYYVICPDMPGRGRSDWLPQPALYNPVSYLQAISHLLAVIGRPVHWVGTSMGGIIGMLAAATPGNPIRKMVLNDLGPFIPAAAIARIGEYLGKNMEFSDLAALEAHVRRIHAPFGKLSDAQWRRLAETSTRRLPDGRVTPHYDPAMVQQFTHYPQDYSLWKHWDALELPVLCLRGQESDLVLPKTLEEMRRRGPGAKGRAKIVEIAGCGHAPALNVPEQLELISEFIEAS